MSDVLTREARGRLVVHVIASAREFGVDAFVTERHGGVSEAPFESLNLGTHVGDVPDAVRANRALVAAAIDVPLERLVTVRQVHGSRVLLSHEVTASSEADALLCDNDDALAILVADCIPLLVLDERSPRFGVVHAGWRGLRAGVIAATLRRFDDASALRVVLGPCISARGYQVGPEVAVHFRDVPDALQGDGERYRLDLRAVARHQLRRAGVRDDAVTCSLEVTDGGATFYSDRAARPCGRFALVAKRAS